MISVRSEVQILPGPPRANAPSAFVASRGRRNASCAESGLVQNAQMREAHLSRARQRLRQQPRERLVQKEAPDRARPARHREGCLVFCLARRGFHGTRAPLSPPIFGRQSRPKIRGCSSVGRAPALQAGGHRFDSVHLHHRAMRFAHCRARGSGCAATARAPDAERSISRRMTVGRSSVCFEFIARSGL